ncbi:uncharacterized protein HKW66_Vig0088440 [Vigna angularis]|uniref:Uncharacterized protein n=1 Tax=Phaseolus angularis TaxID=3914 RepID=A0A8T0KL45_PHAAN|nr:uncharacterized protein HKW66_Vig0088440 [Vigna angularis]
MKIFEWMQNRINGSNGKNKRTSSISSIRRVEPNLGGEQEEHTNDLTKDCLNSEHSEAKENESLSDGSNAMRDVDII